MSINKNKCDAVYNSQDMEAIYMSVSRGTDKEAVAHIHHGILLSHQKEFI